MEGCREAKQVPRQKNELEQQYKLDRYKITVLNGRYYEWEFSSIDTCRNI